MIVTCTFDQVRIAQSFTYNGLQYIKTKVHYVGLNGPYNAAIVDTAYRHYFEDGAFVIPVER